MDHPTDPAIVSVTCSDSELSVRLNDGRKVVCPLWWFPRLFAATHSQRSTWEIHPGGTGVHRPLIDEDLSLQGFLNGTPAPGARPPAEAGP